MFSSIFSAFTGVFNMYAQNEAATKARNVQKQQEALLKEQIIAQREYSNKKLQENILLGLVVFVILFIVFLTLKSR